MLFHPFDQKFRGRNYTENPRCLALKNECCEAAAGVLDRSEGACCLVIGRIALFSPVMSLVQEYSSDEDEDVSQDAFGISSLPASKKTKLEDVPITAKSAPNVLSEVRAWLYCIYWRLTVHRIP